MEEDEVMGEAKTLHLCVGGFLRKDPMSPGVSLLGGPLCTGTVPVMPVCSGREPTDGGCHGCEHAEGY